jgi:hypothetical protein
MAGRLPTGPHVGCRAFGRRLHCVNCISARSSHVDDERDQWYVDVYDRTHEHDARNDYANYGGTSRAFAGRRATGWNDFPLQLDVVSPTEPRHDDVRVVGYDG